MHTHMHDSVISHEMTKTNRKPRLNLKKSGIVHYCLYSEAVVEHLWDAGFGSRLAQ